MTGIEICEHCGHAWQSHVAGRCACGCMWTKPQPPPPSKTEHDELVDRVEDAIWSSLEEVAEEDMGFYVDREMDMVDGSGAGINMAAVAAHLIARLNLPTDFGPALKGEECAGPKGIAGPP